MVTEKQEANILLFPISETVINFSVKYNNFRVITSASPVLYISM